MAKINKNAMNSETYSALIIRKFKKNRVALISFWVIVGLITMVFFCDFFSPNNPQKRNSSNVFVAPQQIHFFDQQGHFHWRPFFYATIDSYDPETLAAVTKLDTDTPHSLGFFVKGWSYQWFGLTFDRHLFGSVNPDIAFYPLGCDGMGRGLLSGSLKGGQISLLLSFIVVFLTATIGTLIGAISAYIGGTSDNVIQRIVEFVMTFPQLPLFLTLISVVPKSITATEIFLMLVIILSSTGWAPFSRQIRSVVLSMRRQEYIKAAFAVGVSDARVILVHILPNITSHIIVLVTVLIPNIVLTESFLSFLGLGVQAPMISWGTLLYSANNIQTLGSHPWLLFPVVFILITVLAFNAFGDGLRDSIDPYSTR